MKNRLILILPIVLSFLISPVNADIVVPLSTVTIPLYPLFLMVELIPFWLLSNKVFSIKIDFYRALLIVAVANIITSLMGNYIYYHRDLSIPLLIAFIWSIIIEFVIYGLFFILIYRDVKKVFYQSIKLFLISVMTNTASYLPLLLLFTE